MDSLMIQIFLSVAPCRLVKISVGSFVFLFRMTRRSGHYDKTILDNVLPFIYACFSLGTYPACRSAAEGTHPKW